MRRPALALLAVVALWLGLGAGHPAAAAPTQERDDLPATNLEAEERDDGTTDTPAWMLGSAVAAVVFIGVGGTVVHRRTRDQP